MNNSIKKEIKEKKREIKKEKLSCVGINLKNALKVPLLWAPVLFCSSGVYLAARQKEYNPLSIYDSGLHTTIETSIDENENIEEKRINSPYENEENHKESNFKSVITEYSGYHKLDDGYYMRTINEYELESDSSNIYEIINILKNYNSNPEKDSNNKANESSISGKRESENIGLAVFKDDKMVGELNALECLSYLNMSNQSKGFFISIPNPENTNSNIDLYLTPTNMNETHVDIVNGSPYISIKTRYSARIYSLDSDSKYLNSNTINTISKACNNYLESTFISYLYKTSKEFKSDSSVISTLYI